MGGGMEEKCGVEIVEMFQMISEGGGEMVKRGMFVSSAESCFTLLLLPLLLLLVPFFTVTVSGSEKSLQKQ